MRRKRAAVHWDAHTGILVIHLPAVADLEIVTEALRRVHRMMGPEALRRRLWDGRKVLEARDLAPIRMTADLVSELLGEGVDVGRAAILSGDGPFHASALRYAERLPEGYPLRVFQSYQDAVDWLLS